jgi:hypothetical protein
LTWGCCEVFAPTCGNWLLIFSLFLLVVLWHGFLSGLILFRAGRNVAETAAWRFFLGSYFNAIRWSYLDFINCW